MVVEEHSRRRTGPSWRDLTSIGLSGTRTKPGGEGKATRRRPVLTGEAAVEDEGGGQRQGLEARGVEERLGVDPGVNLTRKMAEVGSCGRRARRMSRMMPEQGMRRSNRDAGEAWGGGNGRAGRSGRRHAGSRWRRVLETTAPWGLVPWAAPATLEEGSGCRHHRRSGTGHRQGEAQGT